MLPFDPNAMPPQVRQQLAQMLMQQAGGAGASSMAQGTPQGTPQGAPMGGAMGGPPPMGGMGGGAMNPFMQMLAQQRGVGPGGTKPYVGAFNPTSPGYQGNLGWKTGP